MTPFEASAEARENINANAKDFWEGRITEAEANQNLQAILECYDQRIASFDAGKELAKHTHDFSIP